MQRLMAWLRRWKSKTRRGAALPSRPRDWPGLVLASALLTDASEGVEAMLRQSERRGAPIILETGSLSFEAPFSMEWDFDAGRPIASRASPCDFDEAANGHLEPGPSLDASDESLEVRDYSASQEILFGFLEDPQLVLQVLLPLSNGQVDWMLPWSTYGAAYSRMRFDGVPDEGWPEPLAFDLLHEGYAFDLEYPCPATFRATLAVPIADPERGVMRWTTGVELSWCEATPILSSDLDTRFWCEVRERLARVASAP